MDYKYHAIPSNLIRLPRLKRLLHVYEKNDTNPEKHDQVYGNYPIIYLFFISSFCDRIFKYLWKKYIDYCFLSSCRQCGRGWTGCHEDKVFVPRTSIIQEVSNLNGNHSIMVLDISLHLSKISCSSL